MATPAKKPVTLATPANAPFANLPKVDVAEAVEAVAAPARELQDTVRQAAEKGVEETRAAYARVKTAAEEATVSLEKSVKTAADGVVAYNHKLVDAMRANSDAGFDFLKSLLGAKTVSEAITLNSEFARKQFETVSAQSKDLSALAQKLTTEASAPLKDAFGKALAPRG